MTEGQVRSAMPVRSDGTQQGDSGRARRDAEDSVYPDLLLKRYASDERDQHERTA